MCDVFFLDPDQVKQNRGDGCWLEGTGATYRSCGQWRVISRAASADNAGMHTVLIDAAPAAGSTWQQALVLNTMPQLSRSLRLAEVIQQEALLEGAEAAWLTPAERWVCLALGLGTQTIAAEAAITKPTTIADSVRELAPGVERGPWGALAALGAGTDLRGLPWGLALPAHLELGRESLSLADPTALLLTNEEAQALLSAVQPLTSEAGWFLDAREPACWLVAHPSLAEVVTADPARAIARNVATWMPAGAAARPWRQLLTEIQMVWQHHPVNEARVRAGQPEANTLWLHGCGTLPADLRNPFLLLGEPPAHATAWWRAANSGLAVLPASRRPHQLQVVQPRTTREAGSHMLKGTIEGLDQLAADVIERALQDHAGVRVVLAGERRWIAFELRRARRWQFWRRADAHVLLGLV